MPTLIAALPTAVENRTEIDSNSTQLTAIVADTNELQTDWANGGRLDLIVDATLADTNELQGNQGDWATAVGFSTHSAANVRTEMDSNSTQLAAIVADTNELQVDWVDGGRLVAGRDRHRDAHQSEQRRRGPSLVG